MSTLSNAFLQNMLQGGMPVVIVPESMLVKKKKTAQERFTDSFNERVDITETASTTIIPSPKPG